MEFVGVGSGVTGGAYDLGTIMTEPNRKTWQELEDAVERIHRKFHKNATVLRDDHVLGKSSGRLR